MALEDMQSTYGPTNQRGSKGTGKKVDPLAFEGEENAGHISVKSKYASFEKLGKPEKKNDGLAKWYD